MVKMLNSLVDEYKQSYEKVKFQNDCYKKIIEYQEKRITDLEEENKAYKVLLKNSLEEK